MVVGDLAKVDSVGPSSRARMSKRTWDIKAKAAKRDLERDMAVRAILAAKTATS